MNDIKKFNGLNVSSKFAICGLPIRIDSYKTCSFGCKYCFAENRKIMQYGKEIQVANVTQVKNNYYKMIVDVTNELLRTCKKDVIVNIQATYFNKKRHYL